MLRAIFQLIDESIPWNTCITWGAKETEIELIGNTGTVRRVKGKSNNLLFVDGKEFSHVAKNAPDILTSHLNIKDQNIQKQKTPWFLIDMKPGQLSKALNSVSGLSIIDACLKELGSRIRDAQSESRVLNAQNVTLQVEVDSLQYVKEANILLKTIETLHEEIYEEQTECGKYKRLSTELDVLNIQKDKLIPEELEQELSDLQENLRSIQEEDDYLKQLLNIQKRLEESHEEYQHYKRMPDFSALSDIAALNTEILQLQGMIQNAVDLSKTLSALNTKYAEYLSTIEKAEAEVKALPVCPTCGKAYD